MAESSRNDRLHDDDVDGRTLGYDTAPMEGFQESAVRKALEIPEQVRVIALLAIGKRTGPDKPYGGARAHGIRVFIDKWGNGFQK